MDTEDVFEAAKERLGQNIEPSLDYLVKCDAVNLVWYLKEKIVELTDCEQVKDHLRPLKYAYIFCRKGAKVTFVRESASGTPDLMVEIGQHGFYVEVKKFRVQGSSTTPVEKIVNAVTIKRGQLPDSEVGFVAIDNFDPGLERADQGGLSHEHFDAALCELEHLATANPNGWQKPSGVIIAASTSGGIGISIPYFVWVNKQSKPLVPEGLAGWLSSSLTNAEERSSEGLRMT